MDELEEIVKEYTHASVKKPTPATMQTLAWNQLREVNTMFEKGWMYLRELSIVYLGQCGSSSLIDQVSRVYDLGVRVIGTSLLKVGHF